MKRARIIVLAPLVLAACATPPGLSSVSSPKAGFGTVSSISARASGAQPVWLQSAEETRAAGERVHALVHKKTISADTAVQVALLNNRGLQAAYAELGLSAAEAWQMTMQPNPTVSVGVLGIGAEGLNGYRAIEGLIANNILALATRERRLGIAEIRFRQAQLVAAQQTLAAAAETRRAWVEAVGAFEQAGIVRDAQGTADAASELAAELGRTGFLNKADQAREHAFFAELTGQRAQARLDAELAKETLTRAMGLWGSEVDYFVPNALPALPRSPASRPRIEAEALSHRIDLQIAKLELEAMARSKGLTGATRFVTDLEIIAGFEAERELDGTEIETETTPQIEVEFDIPIFDSGQARLRQSEMAYMRAANQLAELAVNVRSEARSAYKSYTGRHAIAGHYAATLLPLRTTIEEESLLSYNGMITNTFELLADTRARLSSAILEANARRDFWLADANLTATIYGGGAMAVAGGGATRVTDPGAAAH
ncbi:TolC family protein [Psychromarinibacter sp. S121]|uniref:TolC family protein n=1 Tax=Psychromarinibacter sp. S121 TaxID=3415127 RepID=UPI003C7CC067